jgi:hypothetical protein
MTAHPHPLAKQAAEKIFLEGEVEPYAMAPLIQTTALDPVFEAGDDLDSLLAGIHNGFKIDRQSIFQALLNWRKLRNEGVDEVVKPSENEQNATKELSGAPREGGDSGKGVL